MQFPSPARDGESVIAGFGHLEQSGVSLDSLGTEVLLCGVERRLVAWQPDAVRVHCARVARSCAACEVWLWRS